MGRQIILVFVGFLFLDAIRTAFFLITGSSVAMCVNYNTGLAFSSPEKRAQRGASHSHPIHHITNEQAETVFPPPQPRSSQEIFRGKLFCGSLICISLLHIKNLAHKFPTKAKKKRKRKDEERGGHSHHLLLLPSSLAFKISMSARGAAAAVARAANDDKAKEKRNFQLHVFSCALKITKRIIKIASRRVVGWRLLRSAIKLLAQQHSSFLSLPIALSLSLTSSTPDPFV